MTRFEIGDKLLARMKCYASGLLATGRTLLDKALLSGAIRRRPATTRYRFLPPIVSGSRLPAVDVSDRNALYDLLDYSVR
jgi:hypothetical protein